MKKLLITLVAVTTLSTAVSASQSHTNIFFIVAKALVTTPSSMEHNGATLESGTGLGFGLDLGYQITKHFAIEVDFSYDQNSVTENINGVTKDATGEYLTYALDLTYVLHITKAMGFIAKVGYEVEDESVNSFHIQEVDHGMVYGVGFEYILNKHYEIVVEYEHSNIISTRGASFYSGLKINL